MLKLFDEKERGFYYNLIHELSKNINVGIILEMD